LFSSIRLEKYAGFGKACSQKTKNTRFWKLYSAEEFRGLYASVDSKKPLFALEAIVGRFLWGSDEQFFRTAGESIKFPCHPELVVFGKRSRFSLVAISHQTFCGHPTML